MRNYCHSKRGFGLVEILVTIAIIAFGSVGVTMLQAAMVRQSAESRTRAEAQLHAQARLDEIRTRVAALPTADAFATALAATSGFTHATAIAGTNAQFTRRELVADAGSLKAVTIRVDWLDPAGDAQTLSLATQLGYVAPQRIGAMARGVTPSLPIPAGSALAGTGDAPDGLMLAAHDDGSFLYRNGDNALALVAGGRIVLLLPEACASSGTQCSHFARIDGRVWIDRATQGSLEPGAVAIVASGASWCTRFYTGEGGLVHPVTPHTQTTNTTAGGDYEWFDYSCYVGSGWYGNVGIAFARGFADTHNACIGDPLATEPAQKPVLATRRVYRGMLYRRDATTASGKEEMAMDRETTVRLYSHGIAPGTVLPDAGHALHDFVIGAVDTGAEAEDGAACITQGIMTRPAARIGDVDGALFAGMPAAFVCLNAHLDDYDATVFGHEAECAVDPTSSTTE